MSLLVPRGGVPQIRRETVTTTGRKYEFTTQSQWLRITNEGANPLEIYFSQEDFDADENFCSLPATTGLFEGPYETKAVWLKSDTGDTTACIVPALRLN